MARKTPKLTGIHPAGENHQVLTLEGGGHAFCRKPCAQCPWRKDSPVGEFPAEAYRHSARTSYDQGMSTFACHMAGSTKPLTCAGFLLNGSAHNMMVRLMTRIGGETLEGLSDGGYELYPSYAAMAIANGVAPDDEALRDCRANDEDGLTYNRKGGVGAPDRRFVDQGGEDGGS